MGTKLQANPFLPEYHHSVIDPDKNISTRYSYHDNHIFHHGNNPNSLASRIYKNGYLGYETEKVKQTILKHEFIFRHQLQELHRLYRKQLELMNEIKRREMNKDDVKKEISILRDMSKTVSCKKRTTIFGVEFSEAQDDIINSESSPGSLLKQESFTLDKKVGSCLRNYPVALSESPSWISSSFLQNLDLGRSNMNGVVEEESDPRNRFKNLDNMNSKTAQKFQKMVPSKGELPWFLKSPEYTVETSKGTKNSYFMNLDSLQDFSGNFFRKKNEIPAAAEDGKDEINHGTSAKQILDFPISNMVQIFKNLNPAREVKRDEDVPRNQIGNNDLILQTGLNTYESDLRHHIDLNLSLDDEEVPSPPSLPTSIVKISTTEIDLEASTVTEFEECDKTAAEIMIAISSFDKNNLSDHGSYDCPNDDCLKWFVEIISQNENRASDEEESIPDSMDHFEFMTLKLEDTKDEYSCYKMEVFNNNTSDQLAEGSRSSGRYQKHHSRRGRKRVDFQNDVLPGLVTLSRHEVTEDFQTFEELFSCKVSSSQRLCTRNGRGRKRSSPVCSTLRKQPVIQLEERSLSGWGKRTRRMPRKRCGNAYLSFP